MRQKEFSFRKIPVSKLRSDKITDGLGPIIGYLINTYVIPKQDINVTTTQLRQDYNNYASHNGWKHVDAARFGQQVSKFLKRRRLGTELERIYHYESTWQEFEQKIEKEGGKINREFYELSDDEISRQKPKTINRDVEELVELEDEREEKINRQKTLVAKRKPKIIIKCNTLEIKENLDDVEQKKGVIHSMYEISKEKLDALCQNLETNFEKVERTIEILYKKREDEYEEIDEDGEDEYEIDEDEEYVILDAKNINKIHEDFNGKEALKNPKIKKTKTKKPKEFDSEKITFESIGDKNRGKQNLFANEASEGNVNMSRQDFDNFK